jgi:outer membrane protein assembly factor BamB
LLINPSATSIRSLNILQFEVLAMIRQVIAKNLCFLFIFSFILLSIRPYINFPVISVIKNSPNAICPATIPGTSDPTEDEWPMFRGQLNHTGEAHTSLINPTIPFSNYATGGGIYSSPAVAGGCVFVGSYDHKVYCLNATTGKSLWSYTTGSQILSSPAVVGGRMYVGSDDYHIYCLNATTGVQLWNYSTDDFVRSSPAVADGCVYVGNFMGRIYCLNATTGEKIWNYNISSENMVWSSPAVAGGRVYVGCSDYKLYCLNATSGQYIRSYSTEYDMRSSPALKWFDTVGWILWVGSGYQVYCLNAITFANYWTFHTEGEVFSSPAVVGERLYIATLAGKVYCLDATLGDCYWSYTTGGGIWSSPAVAGGRVYVGCADYNLYCLDATTGEFLYKYTTGYNIESSPAVADGRVYVGSYDYKIYGPAPPAYISVIESANPLELGAMETITISGVTALCGIQTVSLEFEGNNQTMNNLGGGTWRYTTWTPSNPGIYPYRIYMQDNLGFWNTTSGAIQVVDTTPPTYISVIESADPWELGGTEMIALTGVADLSAIQTVLLEFEGNNHTMTNVGSGIWRYDTWMPNSTGDYPYTIYIQDNADNWNATSGAIQVVDTTPPTYTSVTESANPIGLGCVETIIITGVADLSGIQAVLLAFEGSNHTMNNLSSDTWGYSTWTPNNTGTYPYSIYMQDKAGNWKAVSGVIQVVNVTPYLSVIESADPLELGGTETITLLDESASSGIQTVLLAFEGTNHTMTNTSSGVWRYTPWTPSFASNYSYTIYIQDYLGNWKAIIGAIQVVNTTLPTYSSVTESADSLELGGVETIILSGVADLSGIKTVLIAFEGSNHTMINLGGGTWCYNTWTPISTGTYPYTIYIQDELGNWKAIYGSIQVKQTTAPPGFDLLIWILAFALLGTIILTVILFIRMNKKIRTLSTPKPLPQKDLTKKVQN